MNNSRNESRAQDATEENRVSVAPTCFTGCSAIQLESIPGPIKRRRGKYEDVECPPFADVQSLLERGGAKGHTNYVRPCGTTFSSQQIFRDDLYVHMA
jgi:hypothetical protein